MMIFEAKTRHPEGSNSYYRAQQRGLNGIKVPSASDIIEAGLDLASDINQGKDPGESVFDAASDRAYAEMAPQIVEFMAMSAPALFKLGQERGDQVTAAILKAMPYTGDHPAPSRTIGKAGDRLTELLKAHSDEKKGVSGCCNYGVGSYVRTRRGLGDTGTTSGIAQVQKAVRDGLKASFGVGLQDTIKNGPLQDGIKRSLIVTSLLSATIGLAIGGGATWFFLRKKG